MARNTAFRVGSEVGCEEAHVSEAETWGTVKGGAFRSAEGALLPLLKQGATPGSRPTAHLVPPATVVVTRATRGGGCT